MSDKIINENERLKTSVNNMRMKSEIENV